jgi:lipopolysaccharide biosynthesis protein
MEGKKVEERVGRGGTHPFPPYPPLSLTNPIASTLHAHFTRQYDTLLASLRNKALHISLTQTPTNMHM